MNFHLNNIDFTWPTSSSKSGLTNRIWNPDQWIESETRITDWSNTVTPNTRTGMNSKTLKKTYLFLTRQHKTWLIRLWLLIKHELWRLNLLNRINLNNSVRQRKIDISNQVNIKTVRVDFIIIKFSKPQYLYMMYYICQVNRTF